MGTVYTQLSLQERRRIEDWWLAKVPVAEMARGRGRRCYLAWSQEASRLYQSDTL